MFTFSGTTFIGLGPAILTQTLGSTQSPLTPNTRPRAHVIMRFLGGRSDPLGLFLHVGDSLPILEIELLNEHDLPMDLVGRDVYLHWRLNRGITAQRFTSIDDEANAIVLYPLAPADVSTGGLLAIEAVIWDAVSGSVTSDLCYIPIQDTL